MFSSTILADTVLHDVDTFGFSWASILSTVLYAVLGFTLLILFAVITNFLFKLDIRKELVKDDNVGMGVAIAGLAIATAIIIAGTISS
mgnify:FL=1